MNEKFWLVVQYPLKSVKGNQRDEWLKNKVMEYLNIFYLMLNLAMSMVLIWGNACLTHINMYLTYFVSLRMNNGVLP